MLFLIILIVFSASQTIKALWPHLIETNLVLYLMLFTTMLGFSSLMKNTFNLGFFKCTDQTKVELLMAAKAFGMVFMALYYFGSESVIDFDLPKAHTEVLKRVNQVCALFEFELELPVEFTYCVFSTAAALISFALVRPGIKFAYYFYNLTKANVGQSEQG